MTTTPVANSSVPDSSLPPHLRAPGHSFDTHPGLAEPMTKEDWRDYIDAVPTPAPKLPSLAAYKRLAPEEREYLDYARFGYHSSLVIVETPPMQRLHKAMATTMLMNMAAPSGARRGHIIDGLPTLGKSTILKTFGRNHELSLRRRKPRYFDVPHTDVTPVVYLSVPDGATPKALSVAFARYLGLPVATKATKDDVTSAVLTALRVCRTQLILIDDIHFLDCSQKEGKLANDHLKYLMNYSPATFIYAGVEVADTGLFSEGTSKRKTQTAGRFSVLPVEPFGKDLLNQSSRTSKAAETRRARQEEEWLNLVYSLDVALRLYRHKEGQLTQHWEYLLQRSGGVIASLSALVRAAAISAILDGSERITLAHLDAIPDDITAETDYRQRRRSAKAKKRTAA